jgi:sulfate permease, SulP family
MMEEAQRREGAVPTMPHRYKRVAPNIISLVRLQPGIALRKRLREGYGLGDFKADLMAGVIVGLVAIPLAMALAIASGVAPQSGLYTVIVAGAVVALLGGSRFQVSGPTAAFVVILAPIAQKFGFGGLLTAGLLSGVMLVVMGMARMGKLIQYIPHPVTTGFTAGIAVVIGTLQLKDFFGLQVAAMPERYLEKVQALVLAVPTLSPVELAIGAFTLAALLLWPRYNARIPAPLVALASASLLAAIAQVLFPSLQVATIGNRFTYEVDGVLRHGIPQALPAFNLPWNFSGPDGKPFEFSLELLEALLSSGFAIAMLGAIESLLSAVVADGLAQTKHDPDAELVALGTANVICPFFGGIAATGAIARTATNIRSGARSPLAAVIHAVFTLLAVLLFAPVVSYLPMASLAALLLLVAWNMSQAKHFLHIVRVAPGSDVVVLLLCFTLTVVFDMVVGVTGGMLLSAMLFMHRMAELTTAEVVPEGTGSGLLKVPVPSDVMVYRIRGPLFFGAAEKAVEALSQVSGNFRAVVFLMDDVPVMDVTGLVAFESAIEKLVAHRRRVYIVGARQQPAGMITRAGLVDPGHGVKLCQTLEETLRDLDSAPEKKEPALGPS